MSVCKTDFSREGSSGQGLWSHIASFYNVRGSACALAWTSYNLPSSIVLGGSSTSFSYNAEHQRWKQDANYAGTHEVTYYIGGILEKVTRGSGPTEYRHLIPAGSGAAILTRRSDATTSTYYTTSDHLGSGDLVLSSTGTVLAHESFSPFGARRGSNWQGTPTSADYTTFSTTTRRGFSGHEMLDSVGLVHMNGRVYDPLVGRFLSADPIIQTLAQSQALNPFSYVMNNPLALVDPSGYSWLSKLFHGVGHLFHSQVFRLVLAIAVAIALPYVAAFSQWGIWSAMLQGAIVGGIAAGNLKGAAWGALAGAIAYGISDPSGLNLEPGPSHGWLPEPAKLTLANFAAARSGKEASARSTGKQASWQTTMLVVTRQYSTERALVSTWQLISDGAVMAEGYGIEPSILDRDHVLQGNHIYHLSSTVSRHFGPGTLRVDDPVADTDRDLDSDGKPVLIHRGSVGKDTHGCYIPGQYLASSDTLRTSEEEVQLFENVMQSSNQAYLLIINHVYGIPMVSGAH